MADQPISVITLNRVDRRILHSADGSKTFKARHERTGVRIRLDRHTEQLGVVVARDTASGNQIMASTSLRPMVSRYASDPYDARSPFPDIHLTANDVLGPDVPAQIPGIGSQFAIVGFPVSFDAANQCWYADISMRHPGPIFMHHAPYLRLAVIALDPAGSSAVTVTDPVPLPIADRHVTVSVVGPGPKIKVQTTGSANPDGRVRVTWQAGQQLAPSVDQVAGSRNVLTIQPPPGLSARDLSALRRGRLLIEEIPARFSETVDLRDIL